MKKIPYTLLICFLLTIKLAAQQPITQTKTKGVLNQNTPKKGLKDYYKKYFPIGVAVSPKLLEDTLSSNLIMHQFNSLTAENVMKMGPIHPEENRYNWTPADNIVDFAQKNGFLLRGHNLCWHNQTPKWFFTEGDSVGNQPPKKVTKEVL